MITHKIGDSVVWKINYRQDDGTPINLYGFDINIDAFNKVSKSKLFYFSLSNGTNNEYFIVDNIELGEFTIIIKNTDYFKTGSYDVDLEFIDSQGFKRSSKSFNLRVVERY